MRQNVRESEHQETCSNKLYKTEPIDFDKLAMDLGELGRFQVLICILGGFLVFLAGMGPVISGFTAFNNPHRCFVPACDTSNSSYEEYFTKFTIPYEKETETYEECSMNNFNPNSSDATSYFLPNDFETNNQCLPIYFNSDLTIPCKKWVYDTEQLTTTLVTDFNLVCNRAFLAPLAGSLFMAGMLLGSLLTGIICDRHGRKIGLLVGILVYGLTGVLATTAVSYPLFLIFILLCGAGESVLFNSIFLIILEMITPKWRTFCGIFLEIPYALGEMWVGILAYLLRQWKWLQVAAFTQVLLFVWCYWVIPESIRWLASKDKVTEAIKVVDRIAKFNNVPSPSWTLKKNLMDKENEQNSKKKEEKPKKLSILNLLRTREMKIRALILLYCWFVCSLAYYGISTNSGNLPGNIFVTFILTMFVEIPSYFITYILILRTGRKGTLSILFTIGGLACLASGLLPSDLKWAVISLSLLGKFGQAGAFASICIYTAELYPTEYRAMALGMNSMCARMAGILAPIISSLSIYYQPLPLLIFGTFTLIAGCLIMFLPQTDATKLPQTVEESESLGRNQHGLRFVCCGQERE